MRDMIFPIRTMKSYGDEIFRFEILEICNKYLFDLFICLYISYISVRIDVES